MLQIDESETAELLIEEKPLILPEGYTLSGDLPAQTVTIGGMQEEAYVRVLDEKEYELKGHSGRAGWGMCGPLSATASRLESSSIWLFMVLTED